MAAVPAQVSVIGPILAAAKRIIMKLARPVIKICFIHQVTFNEYVMALTGAFICLEARVIDLERQLQESQQRTRTSNARTPDPH